MFQSIFHLYNGYLWSHVQFPWGHTEWHQEGSCQVWGLRGIETNGFLKLRGLSLGSGLKHSPVKHWFETFGLLFSITNCWCSFGHGTLATGCFILFLEVAIWWRHHSKEQEHWCWAAGTMGLQMDDVEQRIKKWQKRFAMSCIISLIYLHFAGSIVIILSFGFVALFNRQQQAHVYLHSSLFRV